LWLEQIGGTPHKGNHNSKIGGIVRRHGMG
jgi:hypothetical protein